jgi:FAD:protein FMN transferase
MTEDNTHLFNWDAMNTTFTLRLRGVDVTAAAGMARQCFDRLEELESKLSRYKEGGEVWQINHLTEGQTLYISEETHRCLLLALEAGQITGGLFDITLGSRIEHRKSGEDGPLPEIRGRLTIHPDVAAVSCEEAGRIIDLGGIGKGFALDLMAELLIEWGCPSFLLGAGASSLLACGPDDWKIELAGDQQSLRIDLKNQSLSASGTGIQGSHIIHPGGDDSMPGALCKRVWVTAPTAALAEVCSTALMLISLDEYPDFIAANDFITSVHMDREGTVEAFPMPA